METERKYHPAALTFLIIAIGLVTSTPSPVSAGQGAGKGRAATGAEVYGGLPLFYPVWPAGG